LHEGQAYDALDKLHLAIQTFNHNLKFKVDQVCGQGANMHAQAFLRTLSSNKINAADKYWTAQTALLALGLSADDRSLQPFV
jgi:hypothetical protein